MAPYTFHFGSKLPPPSWARPSNIDFLIVSGGCKARAKADEDENGELDLQYVGDDDKKLLKKREGEISQGKLPGIYFDRVRFDELAEDFLRDYRLNEKKSLERAEISKAHLEEYFTGIRVTDITTPKVQAYIEHRMEEDAKNGTINRKLAALKRMLNLGARQTPPKVDRVPYIPLLKEKSNTRKGFFEHDQYLALLKALPPHLRPVTTFGYKTGWREAEILGLTWGKVDMKEWTVRLEIGETKNDHGRTIYLDDELKKLF